MNNPEEINDLRRQLEESNKQLWEMSEAVYKEKKKSDEELLKIKQEKTLFDAEKKEYEEKVKLLWEQSTAIHSEKERIDKLKTEIEYRHREMLDSVHYAKRIQQALLPESEEINASFPQSFVLFKPKDIVSGDFYWFEKKEDTLFVAAADCTGHGVPGSLMSMLGTDKLNNALNESEDVSEMLSLLNRGVKRALRQDAREDATRDGMDIALCKFNADKTMLEFAGANRPLWLVRHGKLLETKATKTAIGGHTDDNQPFAKHSFPLERGDTVYLCTDGFADQFSHNDKKLMTKKFKEILLTLQNKTMPEQGAALLTFINNWKGAMEQTDDILVIGIRI